MQRDHYKAITKFPQLSLLSKKPSILMMQFLDKMAVFSYVLTQKHTNI